MAEKFQLTCPSISDVWFCNFLCWFTSCALPVKLSSIENHKKPGSEFNAQWTKLFRSGSFIMNISTKFKVNLCSILSVSYDWPTRPPPSGSKTMLRGMHRILQNAHHIHSSWVETPAQCVHDNDRKCLPRVPCLLHTRPTRLSRTEY